MHLLRPAVEIVENHVLVLTVNHGYSMRKKPRSQASFRTSSADVCDDSTVPHSGVLTIEQTITGLANAYEMGADLALSIAAVADLFDGAFVDNNDW